MPLKEPLYRHDIAILKKYGKYKLKLTLHKTLRTAGLDLEGLELKYTKKGTVNDEKLPQSIARARNKLYEYAYCNDWDYFITITIDKDKFNRYELKPYHKSFSQFIRDFNKKYGLNIRYLLIPEKHKDGAWHEHGFIKGLPAEYLNEFNMDMKIPYYIRKKLLKGEKIYYWKDYNDKFGFNDIEPIKSREGAAKYLTKYITKDLARSVNELNAKLFYSSQRLNKAEIKKKGLLKYEFNNPDFENDYVKTKTIPFSDEAENSMLDTFL